MATGNAKINVVKGLLSLKVGEEKKKFYVFNFEKHPTSEDIFMCEIIDEFVNDEFSGLQGRTLWKQ